MDNSLKIPSEQELKLKMLKELSNFNLKKILKNLKNFKILNNSTETPLTFVHKEGYLLGQFYSSFDGLIHLAEYIPLIKPPRTYLCDSVGNFLFSKSNCLDRQVCKKCYSQLIILDEVKKMNDKTEYAFKIGDRVEKFTGDYQATGEIRASFLTKSGKVRYVFEFDSPKGVLHIFNENNLRLIK